MRIRRVIKLDVRLQSGCSQSRSLQRVRLNPRPEIPELSRMPI